MPVMKSSDLVQSTASLLIRCAFQFGLVAACNRAETPAPDCVRIRADFRCLIWPTPVFEEVSWSLGFQGKHIIIEQHHGEVMYLRRSIPPTGIFIPKCSVASPNMFLVPILFTNFATALNNGVGKLPKMGYNSTSQQPYKSPRHVVNPSSFQRIWMQLRSRETSSPGRGYGTIWACRSGLQFNYCR